MKKIKQLCTIGLACLFVFGAVFVSACQYMKDIIPETYGEWEQNYLYRGNARTKTTGEDYEQLVTTVEYDGKIYNAQHCVDSKIKGDDIYMILACQEVGTYVHTMVYYRRSWAASKEKFYCLVVYNIRKKTQKVLTAEQIIMREDKEYFYRPTDIEGVFDDRIVLRAYIEETEKIDEYYQTYEMDWYTVDFEGTLMEPSIEYTSTWEWVSDEYLVAEIYNRQENMYELYYRTSAYSDPILVQKKTTSGDWTYVERNGIKGFLIQDKYYKNTPNKKSWAVRCIKFYNFATNTMSEPVSIGKYADFYGDYSYIKTYEYKTIEYYETWIEKKSTTVETNHALYRLIYDESGVHLEEFLTLTDEHCYYIYGIQGNKILYRDLWYQNPRGCSFGGSEYVYCERDLSSGKITEIDEDRITAMEDEYSAVYEQEKGIAVGDYIYFLHEEEIYEGLMVGNSLAYMLMRSNVKTNELEVMQVWHSEDNDDGDDRKFCEEFWFTCIDDNDGYDFYEFTIRPY